MSTVAQHHTVILIFQRTEVLLPAPTWQLMITYISIPGDPMSSSDFFGHEACICQQIHIIDNKIK